MTVGLSFARNGELMEQYGTALAAGQT